MLSFLRARSTGLPPRAPLRDATWDGRVLTLCIDDVQAGERIALDIDGCFFADAPVGAQGKTQFEFAFAPVAHASLLPRRGRDGEPLATTPLKIRFGTPGIGTSDMAAMRKLGRPDVGRIVSFGVDCSAQDVAIVVPVYDAPREVERCLDSVLEHTTGRARLIVIDDASPDPAITPLLERYASRAGVRVLRNDRNRGFTATANRGIVEAGRADVVLLNADTEVGPNWLTGLRRAAACAADIATVTAVSDNAGAFSVPELEQENTRPAAWTFDETARALWHQAGTAYPELPTGNGFCMYIRRAVIDAVGMLDEAAFPQGYGEENDFCQRASAQGLRHLIAGNVYVHHARSSSFGHERRATLGNAGMAVLRERWPNYEADVSASLYSFERRVLDWRVRRVFATADGEDSRMRVVIAGNVAEPNAGAWRLVVDGDAVDLRLDGNAVVSHAPHLEGEHADPTSLDEHLWFWLQAYAIDAVIVAGNFPSELTRLASALGIPSANVERGASAESAITSALASARSFPGPRR
jgi:GT2 family glycosyltransferase